MRGTQARPTIFAWRDWRPCSWLPGSNPWGPTNKNHIFFFAWSWVLFLPHCRWRPPHGAASSRRARWRPWWRWTAPARHWCAIVTSGHAGCRRGGKRWRQQCSRVLAERPDLARRREHTERHDTGAVEARGSHGWMDGQRQWRLKMGRDQEEDRVRRIWMENVMTVAPVPIL